MLFLGKSQGAQTMQKPIPSLKSIKMQIRSGNDQSIAGH